MSRFLLTVDAINRFIGHSVSYLVPLLAFVIMYEVILRFAFDKPTIWAHEVGIQFFSVFIILTGGFLVLEKKHIRVDVLWDRLSPKGKAIADLISSGLVFTYIISLLWFGIPWAWRSFQIRETTISAWSPPLYPFKMMLVVGAFLLLLQLVAKLIRDIHIVAKNSEIAPEAIAKEAKKPALGDYS